MLSFETKCLSVFIKSQWSSDPQMFIHKQPGNLDTCDVLTEDTFGQQEQHKYRHSKVIVNYQGITNGYVYLHIYMCITW